MKLDEIVADVAASSGMKPGELKKAINSVFSVIKKTVEQGEKVSISGLGSFILKTREAGEKIDPKSGEKRTVEATSFIAFKPPRTGDSEKKKKKKA